MYNNYFSVDDRKASTENAHESQEVLDKHKIKQPSLQRKQFRMEEPIESYNQAQKATTTFLNTVASAGHPDERINFFTSKPQSPMNSPQVYSASNMLPAERSFTLMPKATVLSAAPQESEKLVKMKNRKMKKQARKDVKNVKQVIVTEGVTDEYNIENILADLGETESSKKSNNNSKSKKPKAERKRSGKLSSSIGKNKDSKEDKEEDPEVSTTEDEEEDDEEILDKSQPGVNGQDHISSTSQTISSELAPQAAMLNRQTSRSTEDMFTPVIKKHSKWKNKKACMLSKDDSGHTYSSSSSASSTTSSSAVQSTSYASHSSTLSAKPKYNLRRKSALRPSQSFDTMKSASSSVASDDTLEAASASTSSAASRAAKDHLDLAADFPPLSASEAAGGASNGEARADQFVPKWVTKSSAQVSSPSQASQQPSAASTAAAASALIEKVLSHQTTTATETNTDSKVTNAEKTSDQNMKNNPNSSSSSSFSPSAVIDASDVNKKPPEHSELTLPPPPPPDVTVVPLQTNISQQCAANAVMLPDIAAQAPNVMNTTNSSSGVSSNAGDLTPPQTIMMSEPPSFYQLDESDIISSNKAVIILDDRGPEINEKGNNADFTETEIDESAASNCIEFGFEVNVLDLIYKNNQQHLASEDEAIVSFGNTIVLTENHCSEMAEMENCVSGVPQDQLAEENYNNCQNLRQTTADQNQVQTCSDLNEQVDDPAATAVKTIIPNYDQILQYVAKSWNTVEQELENGSAQQY